MRAWHEGWWELGRETGDLLAPMLGVADGHDLDAPERDGRAGDRRVVLPLRRPAPEDRHDRPRVPDEHVSVRGVPPLRRGDRLRAVATTAIRTDLDRLLEAIDERTVLVPLSLVLFRSAYIQDARPSSRRRTGSARTSSSTSIRRPARCRCDVAGARRGLRRGRLGQVAVRRTGRRLPLRAAGSRAARSSRGSIGWAAHAAPFAFATGPVQLRRGAGAVPERHAQRAGALCGARRIRDRRARSASTRSARSRCG